MDIKKWETILLHWISECGFMECNHIDIAHSNIETFFQKYSGFVHIQNKSFDLVAFLKEQYPEFQPRFSIDYVLSSSDYVYVYSLLLHFSCVKYPEKYFHDICHKLPAQSQQSIVEFFKLLLDCNNITKEIIHHVIVEVIKCGSLPSPSFECLPTASKEIQGPLFTSTPEKSLLEDRTGELYNLKALLETERYQNGILEKQINQSEDKILKLHQDYINLQQQMQDLRNDIITVKRDTDKDKQVHDEQIKQKFYKIISQKEEDISNLRDIISTFKEEKDLLQEKLSFADKQIVVCLDHINDLDHKAEQLSAELKKKNDKIELLTENRLELEEFIAESRANAGKSHSDLSASINEFLETSSSFLEIPLLKSKSVGNNLGSSVIDVQLREKEIEAKELRESLDNMRLDNYRSARRMNKIALQHSKKIRIEQEKVRKLQGVALNMRESEEKRIMQLNQALQMLRNILQFFKTMPHSRSCINLESDEMIVCFHGFGKVIVEELKSIRGMI